MFESAAELNYLGWPKLVLGSAHVKLGVWTGPSQPMRVSVIS